MKKDNNGYYRINREGKNWLHHRWVWKEAYGDIPSDMVLHHINGVRHDNRLGNLTLITQAENCRKYDTVGKGYRLRNNGSKKPYEAYRSSNKKQIHLGCFGTACGAYMASRMAIVNGRIKCEI